MIYFTADPHFCHGNIIVSCKRPYGDVTEMNRDLIDRWNSMVTKRDEIYILGDFAYRAKPQEVNEILSKLKGRKYLIRGNHDFRYLSSKQFDSSAFEWVKDYHLLKYEGGLKFILFHYPLLSWDGTFHGSIHLYGHVHNSVDKKPEFAEKVRLLGPKAINVGVDVNDFYPVSIKQILERVEKAKEETEAAKLIEEA